jgi:glycerophosphoryl diester phosphodiesterase
MLRLAHRGDHARAPENTLAAFAAALARPDCDGLEFDVRASADGVAVVVHDATLARVQGRPEAAADLSAAALRLLGVPVLLSRTGYTGEWGYELYLPPHEVARFWERLTAEIGRAHV